jgi:hypothetical protein
MTEQQKQVQETQQIPQTKQALVTFGFSFQGVVEVDISPGDTAFEIERKLRASAKNAVKQALMDRGGLTPIVTILPGLSQILYSCTMCGYPVTKPESVCHNHG